MVTKFVSCFNAIMPGGPYWMVIGKFSGFWVEHRDDEGPGWHLCYDANGDYFGTVHDSGLSDTEQVCNACDPPPPPVYYHDVRSVPDA